MPRADDLQEKVHISSRKKFYSVLNKLCTTKMNIEEFREFGKASVDYIADYFENIRKIEVMSQVEPGYLKNKLPQEVPPVGEPWQKLMEDVDRLVVPGLTHWHSPHFHAYFPTANSFPGVVGELFLSGLGTISKDWETNPACVELEVRMLDWLAKILGLPEEFLNSSEGLGGGVIQNAASESTLVGLLSGKQKTVRNVLSNSPNLSEGDINGKLVAYTSKESNSSVEKAGLLASVKMRLLPTDKNGSLRGYTLAEAIKKDKKSGLIPCCVVATLGTTGICAFDNLEELGQICSREGIWLHVDAAYAGAAFACPEYRYLMKGVENANSFNFNPHKWMLVNSDCSAMWFKDTKDVEKTFKVKSTLPKFEPEIEHWQIPTSRRFRALKLWFVLRIYGVQGIQRHIRHQISLAKYFEDLARNDDRFEVCICSMGLVCFKLKGEDSLTQNLLDKITERNRIFLMPYYYRERLVIRFVICSRFTEKEDILYAWREITSLVGDGTSTASAKDNDISKEIFLKQDLERKNMQSDILNTLSPSKIPTGINENVKIFL